MVNSMTGFAAQDYASDGLTRAWEMRSVNGKGLDVRMRLPDRLGRLENTLRERIKKRLTRGNVSLTLRLTRDATSGATRVNEEALLAALDAISQVSRAAAVQDMPIALPSPTDVLGMHGVLSQESVEIELPEDADLVAEFDDLVAAHIASRASEGATLDQTLRGQIAQMRPLIASAAAMADARRDDGADRLREAVAKLIGTGEAMDPDRLAQELALLAVKGDVTEEIDRLNGHVGAAEALLQTDAPIGRRFDFLMQEFNREANTLCSKSADAALTQVGLDLKVLIDQMREQVQNVE